MADQPDRSTSDGAVECHRVGDLLVVTAVQNGHETRLTLSEYNAWRVFAILAVMLGIALPKKLMKCIKL